MDPARSFDRAAEEYEQARPGYPAELLDLVPLARDSVVADVGAGTGKLTRVLAARYARVIAVEPLDGMRGVLERVVPEVEAHAASAEQLPLEDESLDGVFAAQAFHWFDQYAAVAEFARVLRPGGILVLVWNEPRGKPPTPPEYNALLERLHRASMERIAAQGPWSDIIRRGPFGEVHDAHIDHDRVETREQTLTQLQTVSWIAHRPDEERAQIARELDALLSEGPFTFGLRSNVKWAARL